MHTQISMQVNILLFLLCTMCVCMTVFQDVCVCVCVHKQTERKSIIILKG